MLNFNESIKELHKSAWFYFPLIFTEMQEPHILSSALNTSVGPVGIVCTLVLYPITINTSPSVLQGFIPQVDGVKLGCGSLSVISDAAGSQHACPSNPVTGELHLCAADRQGAACRWNKDPLSLHALPAAPQGARRYELFTHKHTHKVLHCRRSQGF